jgi:WD40 repeat protein
LRYPLEHIFTINRLEFSPDGRFLATGSSDWTAQLWDAVTGSKTGPPLKHTSPVSVGFSPDGKRLLTVAETVAVWRVPTGEQILRLKVAENRDGRQGEFSLDGRRIAIACGDGTAWVLEAESGKVIISVRHQRTVHQARFSPDGRWLLTASEDGTAGVWDSTTGVPVCPPVKHSGPVVNASFSPDGRRFVTAGSDGIAELWYSATGTPVTAKLKHAAGWVWVAFSPDGQRLVTASEGDYGARLWDLRGVGASLAFKHAALVKWASFSPDSRRVLAVSVDGTAHVWDLGTGQPLSVIEPNLVAVRHAQFSPDGSLLATAATNGTARVWDLDTGRPISPPLLHTGLVNYVEFSRDGKLVVTAGSDRFARVWELPSGRLVSEMRHRESVNYAWFTPDVRKVVTANMSVPECFQAGGTRVVTTAEGYHRWNPDPKWTFDLTEREAISAIWGQAQSWDVATGKPDGSPRNLGAAVSQVAISPDRRKAISTCSAIALAENQVAIIDLQTGRHPSQPIRHNRGIIHASFSPNGKAIVTASWDRTARVWDAATGRPVGPWLSHGDAVYAASFSPDNRLIVTASRDQTARVWDVATGEPVTPPLKHAAAVHWAFFSPDGRRVLTTSVDGTLRVWELQPSEQPAEAELARAQIFAAHYVDATGAVSPVGPEGIRKLWLEWHQQANREEESTPVPTNQVSAFEDLASDEFPGQASDTHPTPTASDLLVRQAFSTVNELGYAFSSFGSNDLVKIVEQFSRAIDSEPDADQRMYLFRSWAYERLGEYQKAIEDNRESLWRMGSYVPDRGGIGLDYLFRGRCYARLGENEKAEADFQAGLGYCSQPVSIAGVWPSCLVLRQWTA